MPTKKRKEHLGRLQIHIVDGLPSNNTKVHRAMVQPHLNSPMRQYLHGISVPRMQQALVMGLLLLFFTLVLHELPLLLH
jgi:hypothetical protein